MMTSLAVTMVIKILHSTHTHAHAHAHTHTHTHAHTHTHTHTHTHPPHTHPVTTHLQEVHTAISSDLKLKLGGLFNGVEEQGIADVDMAGETYMYNDQ